MADDFTLFEWNANLEEIWDQLLTVLETQEGKDMEMWEKGPWSVLLNILRRSSTQKCLQKENVEQKPAEVKELFVLCDFSRCFRY